MTSIDINADAGFAAYWEARAQRYAAERDGLAAVCSYGMPEFYNRYIDLCQRRALAPWLRAVTVGDAVLDVGCGVGRWSRVLAGYGARVTGVDFSETMLAEARRRTTQAGLAERCSYERQDVTDLRLQGRYRMILAVTVLQHVLDPGTLSEALRRLAAALLPGGRIVLLEVAPALRDARCDTAIFHARPLESYCALLADAGLQTTFLGGVDPAPFKTWLLPHYSRLPKPLGVSLLAAATLCSLPIDLALSGVLWRRSWHKLIVAQHQGDP